MSENETKRKLKSMGWRVKQAREEMKLTQEQFAEKYGYPRSTLAKLEAGIRDFKSTEIIKLAEQLNVSTDYLLGITDVKSTDIDIKAFAEAIGLSDEVILQFGKMQHNAYYDFENKVNEYKYMLHIANYLIASDEFNMALMALSISAYLKMSVNNLDETITAIQTKKFDKTPADIVIESGNDKSILDTAELYSVKAADILYEAAKLINANCYSIIKKFPREE